MKSNPLSKLKTTILLLGGGLLALTAFASCDNFLKGAEIKDEILDTIAYNNAQQCTVVFRADSDKGEFLGSVERTFHVGYESEVQFEVNKDDYIFKGLEAVSQSDKETSRADCVEFNEISKDDKKGIYKYNVKLLKESKDVLIRPVCIALPKITEILPKFESNGCDQDTAIQITFNKALDPKTFDPSCISIYSDENLKDYFGTPEFTSDNKSLYIPTIKDKHILPPDEIKALTGVEVNYDFTNVKDADGFSLTAQGTHSYKINKNFGNQKKVIVTIQSNSQYGSFLSDGQKECTVGYTVDLQFTFFKDYKDKYKFIQFEAVNLEDDSINYKDIISLENEEYNDDRGIYKAKIRIISEQNNILIRPLCVELPAVISYSPDTTDPQSANSPITIDFNMPIKTSINQAAIISALKLTYYGSDVSEYFETPEFEEDGKSLTIMPKTDEDSLENPLSKFIKGLQNTKIIEIVVSMESNFLLDVNGISLPFQFKSFNIRYKTDVDLTPPEEYDFFITRKKITIETASALNVEDKFESGVLDLSDISSVEDKIRQNRTNGIIYIYGLYRTKTGIRNISVVEQRVNDSEGNIVDDLAVTTTYNKNSSQAHFTSVNGDLYFCIEHHIKQGDEYDRNDGAFLLNVSVINGAGVSTEPKLFTAIKKSKILFNIENAGGIFEIGTGNAFYNKYKYNEEISFYDNDYIEDIKNSYVWVEETDSYVVFGYLYKDVALDYSSYTLEYQYADNERTKVPADGQFLLDVESVCNTKITIYASDDLGNVAAHDFTIPASQGFMYSLSKDGDTTKIQFYHDSGNPVDQVLLIKCAPDGTKTSTRYGSYNGLELTLLDGYNYQIAPCLYDESKLTYFYTEVPEYLVFNSETEILTAQEVELKNVEGTELPVEFTKREGEPRILFGTIFIADDSWTKFDAIYVDLKLPHGSISGFYNERLFFEKNSTSITFDANTKGLFDSGCSFIVYGIANNAKSTGVECIVPKLTDGNKYDNIGPGYSICLVSEDYYEFTITDEHAGPDYGILTLRGIERDYRADASNNYVVKIPTWDVKAAGGFSWKAVMCDTAGNKSIVSGSRTTSFQPSIKSISKNNNKWRLSMSAATSAYGKTYNKIYTINDSNQWTLVSSDQLGLDITLPADSMIKIVRWYKNDSYASFNGFSTPFYFYTGTKSSGNYDLLWQNGSSKTSVAIQSDAPVFAHTLITDRPYSECVKWTATDWEYYTKHAGDNYIIFAEDDKNPRRYSIPVDEVEDGECYCVIAHFADNHVEMSEVMQK